MRSDDTYTPTEGCSAEELLKCLTADDYDACVAACSAEQEEEEEVANGFVTISKVSAAATQEVAFNAVKKNVGTIKLTAGEDGATISSVVVKRDGLGSNKVSVQLTNDKWTIVTSAKTMNSNWEATVRFSPALTLKANESVKLDVLVNLLWTSANANEVHNFSVIWANLANGKAEWSAVLGSVRTTSYEVSNVTAAINGATSIKAGETKSIAKVTLTAWKKDVVINWFTLTKVEDTTNVPQKYYDEAFWNVKAYYNNKEIWTVTMTNNKLIVTDLNINRAAGESAVIDLKADSMYIGWTAYVTSNFDATSDIDVKEADTKEAMQISQTSFAGLTAVVTTLTSVDLTLTKVSTWTITVAPGTSNITLFNWKIESSTEFDVTNYTLLVKNVNGLSQFTNNSVTLTVAWNPIEITNADLTPVTAYNVANCDDGTSATYAACIAAGNKYTDAAGYTVTFTTDDAFGVVPGTAAKVTVKWTAKNSLIWSPTHQFQFTLNTVRDVNNASNTITVSKSLLWDQTTISNGSLTLKNSTVAAPTATNIWANASDLEVARFGVKADSEDITIWKVKFAEADTYNDYNLTSLISSAKLVNVKDGSVIASNWKIVNWVCSDTTKTSETACTATWTPWYIEFDGLSLVAEKDVDLNVKLLITTNSFTADSTYVKFNTIINWTDTSRESVWNATMVAWWTNVAVATNIATLTSQKRYKVNIQSPEVTLVKQSDSVFKVTVTNKDANGSLWLWAVTLRVKPVADSNTSYNADYYLREEWSNIITPATLLTFAASTANAAKWWHVPWPAVVFWFGTDGTDIAPVEIAKNSSYTFEIYVDSEYVNPTTLMAELSSLNFATTSTAIDTVAELASASVENYELSAQ